MKAIHDVNAASVCQELGIHTTKTCCYQLGSTDLIEAALRNNEGVFSNSGALVVNTAPYTGRSPNDKYMVSEGDDDLWFSSGTHAISAAQFASLKAKMLAYYDQHDVYIRDMLAGADPKNAAKIRILTDLAWQNAAADNMLIDAVGDLPFTHPDLTLIVATGFAADPVLDGTRSPAFVILNFEEKTALIGTTRYAGEIKKTVFTFMNYIMPKRGILSLHCSANTGKDGAVALFFGLSGTGKTTLSSDPQRALIGDDEHGWSDDGVFNFEGGCYAKTIRINPDYEPLVWSAINRFGTILENVPLNEQRQPDFDSAEITENTRAAYPLEFIPNFEPSGTGGHPSHIFFLTADAFGVLPPLGKLSNDQALYYFLSGYTSKLAGTERGLGDKPEATFSTCFGAPFLPLRPAVYADLLAKKLQEHGTHVWLLNTGWSGGGYGFGQRISLPITRAMISAVLSGSLDTIPSHIHPVFRFAIPDFVAGVPAEVLDPERLWADAQLYRQEADMLANKFRANFAQYAASVPAAVTNSGPRTQA